MSVIKSKDIYSPQNYCIDFLDVCPIFRGEKDELRAYLDNTGHEDLWDYPFDEIDYIVENNISVVLIDSTYIDDKGEMIHEHRWFEIPKELEGANV